MWRSRPLRATVAGGARRPGGGTGRARTYQPGTARSAPRPGHHLGLVEVQAFHSRQTIRVTTPTRRGYHLSEGAVHRLLHGRSAEDLGCIVEERVIDVHQSLAHSNQYIR